VTRLVINDLEEDVELDILAMRAISGGKAGLGPIGALRGPASSYRKLKLEESKLVRGLYKLDLKTTDV